MSIGPSELLFVAVIVLVLIFISRGQKARRIRKEQEAVRAEALRATKTTGGAIRYPELQLLGIVVIVAGLALGGIGYLMTRGILDFYSVAGIAILALGISFVIMARQKVSPVASNQKSNVQSVSRTATSGKQSLPKSATSAGSIDPKIKPEDMADFKRFMALKAGAATPGIEPEDSGDYKKYLALKAKAAEKS
ncbi:hypothetical protein [Dehalogenimonas etheniformans]|uniref:Uncharacterized protein n=1 Tax=Dehalogenimonas etheniformans TaxID=1536648 RepID=A0A2P5P7E7_9CHLR|nr:hypothetical protein [Dehalogenimonas etheniformans]PPD58210.1 hypothetical protein JP09_005310 [Dehalogenimonas etheniformans]QNT75619.1 hypothetical protein HX448_02405 [Dehalogenimonas etheniformans]